MAMEMELVLMRLMVVVLWMQARPLVSAASNNCSRIPYLVSYPQMEAIANLYTNWSRTPIPEVNLLGWQPVNVTFTDSDSQWWSDVCDSFKWKGLECVSFYDTVPGYMYNCTETITTKTYRLTGLTLNNASITGPLPEAIGDLDPLNSLTVTGNPGLHGNIPQSITKLWRSLTTLDLHDNNLTGGIPFDYKAITRMQVGMQYFPGNPGTTYVDHFKVKSVTCLNPETCLNAPLVVLIDLSGNRFSGDLPIGQGTSSNYDVLRTFKFARNHLTGNIPGSFFLNMSRIESVDLSNNKFSGPVPSIDFSCNPLLTYLNMSGNQFTAVSLESIGFSSNASSLIKVLDFSNNVIYGVVNNLTNSMIEALGPQLQELYLDNNHISGTLDINSVLQSTVYRQNSSFKMLSLTKNNITAVRYNKIDTVNIRLFMRLADNPFCDNIADICSADGYAARCFCFQNCAEPSVCNQAETSNMSTATILKIALSISVPFILLLLVAALLLYRSRRQHQDLLRQVQQICEEHDVKPTIFTYSDLRAATRDFHPDRKLGEGGYGAVYKGVLPNGNVVAVKQLHIKSQQGMADFLNEVALISGIKHCNLVKLKGCCIREKQRLLVYEYVDNHNLDWNLVGGKSLQVLSWSQRLSICFGIANGLHYLHALAQPKIIHRDIKAANILLDNNLQPKIADFGLALLFPEEQSHIMTVHVAGTKGYLAPEYATLGHLSEKVDVYSFGVVCLEIVSGRRNIDNKISSKDQVVLTNWVQKLYKKGNIMDIVDPKLELLNENELLEVLKVISIAILCVQYAEDVRPTMARVIFMLQGGLSPVLGDLEFAQTLQSSGSSSFEISQLEPDTISEVDNIYNNIYLQRRSSSSTYVQV